MTGLEGLAAQFKEAREAALKHRSDLLANVSSAASDVAQKGMGVNVTPTGFGVSVKFEVPPGTRVVGMDKFGARASDRLGMAARQAVETAVARGLE